MGSGSDAQHWFLSMPWIFCKERSLVEKQQRHQGHHFCCFRLQDVLYVFGVSPLATIPKA